MLFKWAVLSMPIRVIQTLVIFVVHRISNRWSVMSESVQTASPSVFKDRSTGLIIYGFFQIALGGLAALMIPLMLVSIRMSPPGGGGATVKQVIPAIGVYAIFALTFICLGVGSILARRWARALTLVLSWMWLAVGVVSLAMMVIWLPKISNLISAQGQELPPQALTVMYVTMFGTLGCMYLVLPGIFITFYQRADVKATCDAKDAKIRWTDHCPLPVLSLSLLLALGATSILWSAGYDFVTPLFGVILKGIYGAIFFFGFSAVLLYLAWAIYKMRLFAWWATLAAFVLFGLSTIVTFSRISLMDLYREMDFPEDQLKTIEEAGVLEVNVPLIVVIYLALFIGYMLWVRTYMVAGSRPASDSEASG